VQKAVRPSSQLRQRPSATLNGITTLSPFFRRDTPDPVSRTMPMFSWPVSLSYQHSNFSDRDVMDGK
jgi:hypothetical protein